jgi:hypothetical protein
MSLHLGRYVSAQTDSAGVRPSTLHVIIAHFPDQDLSKACENPVICQGKTYRLSSHWDWHLQEGANNAA